MAETSLPATARLYQPATSPFSHADIMRVMFGVMICILLAALDQTAVIPAVPAIASDLGAYTGLSWVVAAYLITSTISTPVYGKLSDIYGRRRLLITCLALFIVTSMLCGAAQSLHQLVWFRALQGLGGGGLMALTQAAIADVVSPRERGRYQAYISAVWAIASLSGPLVGGLVTQSFSWRWIFWINLPIGAAAMWVCRNGLRRVPPPLRRGRPRLDIIGMLLLAGAISLLLLALGWGGTNNAWGSYQIFSLAGFGACLLLLLVLQELRARDPLLPPRVFMSPSYVSYVIVSTLTSVLLFMCLFTIPLYFQYARGATAAQSGIYVAPFMLASAFGNVAGSRWARRFGTVRGGLRIASALSCAGLILLAVVPLHAPVWAVIAAMVIAGPGMGGCLIGSMMGSQNALGAQDIGSGTGALLVLRSVGGATGSTIAGAIIASGLIAVRQTIGNGPAETPAVQRGSVALGQVAQSGVTAASAHLGWSFPMVYAVAAVFAATSFLVAMRMPNTPLRESLHAVPLSE
jgi:EmrB/QacA subfamily drug resistance transporter